MLVNESVRLSDIAAAAAKSAEDDYILYPIAWVIPITVVYAVIFVLGLVGNVSTCVVIARNKSLHTVTNYYLFSIAVSDLLLLISGLPPEMYRIWSPETYVFGEPFCVLQGYAAETSANATVLTITAFTVERYLAICHPFLSHKMSNLSRATVYIVAIWLGALLLAAPQAVQFGVKTEQRAGVELSWCTVVAKGFLAHAFEISTFIIFVGPMTLITVLYILIAVKLNKSKMLRDEQQRQRMSTGGGGSGETANVEATRATRKMQAQNRVIKMLVAVVVAFFICWAPFHAQRLLAVYLSAASAEAQKMCIDVYVALTYISGVLYFLSTTVNPILYHIMSNKFRQAFKSTFYEVCKRGGAKNKRQRTYSMLSRCGPSLRHYQRSVSDGVQHYVGGDERLYMMELQRREDQHNGHTVKAQQPPLAAASTRHTRIPSQSSNTTQLTTISKSLIPASQRMHMAADRHILARFLDIFHQNRVPETQAAEVNGCPMATAKTDDISNSSLQDCDEMEYSSSDLAKYMEEVNDDLASAAT